MWCDFLLAFSLFSQGNVSLIVIVDPVLRMLYVALESVLRSVHMGDIAS